MDTLASYREIIQRILAEYTLIPYAYGELRCETVFDVEQDRYLAMTLGWERGRRVHGCLLHLEIIDGYIWIQRDGTEEGVALALTAATIPKDRIVLGFQPPEMRQYTDYAAVSELQ